MGPEKKHAGLQRAFGVIRQVFAGAAPALLAMFSQWAQKLSHSSSAPPLPDAAGATAGVGAGGFPTGAARLAAGLGAFVAAGRSALAALAALSTGRLNGALAAGPAVAPSRVPAL